MGLDSIAPAQERIAKRRLGGWFRRGLESRRGESKLFKWLILGPGVLVLLLFFAAPLAVIVRYSLLDGLPFAGEPARTTFANYPQVLGEGFYYRAFIRTGIYAVVATAISLVISYPVAYYLARRTQRGGLLLIILLIPFWTSTVLRILAWRIILESGGIVRSVLDLVGFPDFRILYTPLATIIGLVYIYTPFMVLPLYAVLGKVPEDLIQASQDLGAGRLRTLFKVTFPLTRSGTLTGIMLVLLSAFGDVLASEYLGGGRDVMMGTVVYDVFVQGTNWNVGSAAAVMFFTGLLIIGFVLSRIGRRELLADSR
jgi:spermidine/putrescine transport system permease protein